MEIILIIILLLIAGCIMLYYSLILKPKKLMKYYGELFQKHGFKVHMQPFRPMGSFMSMREENTAKYGDCHYFQKNELVNYDVQIYNTLHYATIQLVSPSLQKEFFEPKNIYKYHKLPMLTDNMRRVFGNGLLFAEEIQWKHRRKVLNSVFNHTFLVSNIDKMKRIFGEGFDAMEKDPAYQLPNNNTLSVDIINVFAESLGNVILECFFGISSLHTKINGKSFAFFIGQLNKDINLQTFSPIGLLLGKNFLKLGLREKDRQIQKRVNLYRSIAKDLVMQRIVEQGKEGKEHKSSSDIVSILFKDNKIEISQKYFLEKSSGQKYGIEELIDEFSIFYSAGIDTSSHFMMMMVYLIARDQRIKTKLKQEIQKFIKSQEDINIESLKKLSYVDWIQSETTRFYGPATGIFERKVIEDHLLGQVPIKKGVLMAVQPLGTHYNPKYFKDPKEFRPERWQNQCKNIPPFAFTGFSGGPRSCIGKHLALLKSKIGLIIFMLRYKDFTIPKKDFSMHLAFLPEPEKMKLSIELK